MKERVGYRARKWLVQQVTSASGADQFARLRETDWDILVILDACRADVLRQAANWPVKKAISPASCTPQWLQKVVSSGIFANSRVFSGNPQYEKIESTAEKVTIERCWETDWDERCQTVLPEPILDRATEAVADGSRVVAHLQQPHWPYVAQLSGQWLPAYDHLGPWSIDKTEIDSVQVAMQRGLIDVESARRAYEASVRSVWETLAPYLARWVSRDKTVIVTADHGETFGRLNEYGFYEHPCSCHLRPLVEVPWVELHPAETEDQPDDVEQRLRALGYAE